MKIICSAGKGTMEKEDCLACALARENTCGYDYTLLKSLFGGDEDRSAEIHVTDLTGCLLRAYLDKKDPQPEFVHEKLAKGLGVLFHKALEVTDEHVDAEVKLAHDGIVGRADVVYKSGRLVDLKTTRWISPEKLPYGSHELQVNIYAYLLKQMGAPVNSLAIQYIDLSGPTKCRGCKTSVRMDSAGVLACPKCGKTPSGAHLGAVLVEVRQMTDREIKSYVEGSLKELDNALKTGKEPQADPSYLCAYCAHVDRCPAGQNWKY